MHACEITPAAWRRIELVRHLPWLQLRVLTTMHCTCSCACGFHRRDSLLEWPATYSQCALAAVHPAITNEYSSTSCIQQYRGQRGEVCDGARNASQCSLCGRKISAGRGGLQILQDPVDNGTRRKVQGCVGLRSSRQSHSNDDTMITSASTRAFAFDDRHVTAAIMSSRTLESACSTSISASSDSKQSAWDCCDGEMQQRSIESEPPELCPGSLDACR